MDARPMARDPVVVEPSIGELVGDVVGDAQALVRGEVNLALVEVREEVREAREGLIALATSGIVITIGGLLLVLTVVYILADVLGLPLWTSYLITGASMTFVGVIMRQRATHRIADVDPVPHQAIESVRKDIQWLKQQTASDKT